MVVGGAMVLGGGSLDPRYQPQLKAPSQSGGLTHGAFQSLMSQQTTRGHMPVVRSTEYRPTKRARDGDGETLVSKQLHTDSTRDVSQLHQHGINIRPAEPEPEPQRTTNGTTANATATQHSIDATPTASSITDMDMPRELAVIDNAAAVRMLDAVRVATSLAIAHGLLSSTVW